MAGDTPTNDNAAADIVNKFIDTLLNAGAQAAEAYLISLDPLLLSNPIVKFLLDRGVGYIEGLLDGVLKKIATSLVIDFQINQEKSEVFTTLTALQFAIASNDSAAIEQAKQGAINAWAAVIHFDGSTNTPINP
jgi:hypothetical protein